MIDFRTNAYKRYESFSLPDYSAFAASYSRRLDRRICLLSEMRCLDVACGFGNFLSYLKSRNITFYIGVDSSHASINAVRNHFGEKHGICQDIFTFLVNTEYRFDLISAIDFIEHLTKDELQIFIDQAAKHLTKGGKLLVRVPNAAGLFGMHSRYNDITHEICFTPNSLRDVLRTNGFSTIAIWEDTGKPCNLRQYVHRTVWEVVRFGVRSLDAIETGMWSEGILTRNMWAVAVHTGSY